MGQSAHPGRSTGQVCALVAATALAAGVLTGCSSSIASATTVLRGVLAVTVVHSDGTSVPGGDGLKLRSGDVVRTGAAGRAELVTRSRVVYLGSQAALRVVDGANQELRHGAAVVDAQAGPGLDLQVASLAVTAPTGSAVRAERSVTVRLGTLAGKAEVVSGSGRRLSVPALRQAMVGGDALPDDTTPLRLTDDDGEAHAVPDLVRDDVTINGLAAGMDTSGPSTARAVDAAWHGPLSAPVGTGRSERLLPAVIASAGPASGELGRYRAAVGIRQAGGSWGVVARVVGVRASGVVAALAAFERNQSAGSVPTVRQVLAGARGDATTGSTHPSGGQHSDGNGGTDSGSGDNGGGSSSPTPSPTPSPTGGGLVSTVTDTVGKVLSLIPTPSPTKTSAPQPIITLPGLPHLP